MFYDPTIKAKPQDNPEVEKLILAVRKTIRDSKLNLLTLFDQFDYQKDNELDYQEFYRALKYFDKGLSRDEIFNIFNELDKDNKGKISRFNFATIFSELDSTNMADFLDWAHPIFCEINAILDQNKIDIETFMKPQRGYLDANAFRSALHLTGFDVNKYSEQMLQIQEVLQECTPDRVNFNIFIECLNRAKSSKNTKKSRKREDFKPDDLMLVKEMLKDIIKFIKLDNLKFDDLFLVKDFKKNATIKIEDLHKTLLKELYLDDSPNLNLLYDYFRKEDDYIDLVEFKKGLDSEDRLIRKVLNLDNFLRELKNQFNYNVYKLLDFFDVTKRKRINLQEWINGCKRLMNLDKEMAEFFFREMDTDNNGELTTVELQDILDREKNRQKELVHKTHEFVFNHKNYLLKCLESLDKENTHKLPDHLIKIGFSNAGLILSANEVDALIARYDLTEGQNYQNNYEYMKLIEGILKEDGTREFMDEADHGLERLKKGLAISQMDFIEEMHKLDPQETGKLPLMTIFDKLAQFEILIEKFQREAILVVMRAHPDSIDYYQLFALIQNDQNVKKGLNKQEFMQAIQVVRQYMIDIRRVMTKNYLTIDKLFGNDKEVVHQDDFVHCLEYIGFREDNFDRRKLISLLGEGETVDHVSLKKLKFVIEHLEDSEGEAYLDEQQKFVQEKLEFIKRVCIEDKKTFDQAFRVYSKARDGAYIQPFDMQKALVEGLGINANPQMKRFIQLLMDNRSLIQLEPLERRLNLPKQYNTKHVVFAGDINAPNLQQSISKSQPQIEKLQLSKVSSMMGGSVVQGSKDMTEERKSASIRGGVIGGGSNIMQQPLTKRSDSEQFSQQLQARVLNGAPAVESSHDLKNDLKVFFKLKSMSNQERYILFDNQLQGRIQKQVFINVIRQMNIKGVDENKIMSLFSILDTNKTGYISENEFRLAFDDDQAPPGSISYRIDPNEEEIREAFRMLDENSDNKLTLDELIHHMSKMGMNMTNAEAASLFQEMDENKDGVVTYDEFRHIIHKKQKNDLVQLDDLLSQLRSEFRKVDTNNNGMLIQSQLQQAFQNLGITVSDQDVDSLFRTVDTDQSGTIDIDEFIGFIMSPPNENSMGSEVNNAVFNIRKANRISIVEMLQAFDTMPFNFIFSFSRDQTRKLNHLPSSTLKPIKEGGSSYRDITPNLNRDDNSYSSGSRGIVASRFGLQPVESQFAVEIKLLQATGIPIPNTVSRDQQKQSSSILGRELRVMLFSKANDQFVGNIVSIPCDWSPQYEDRWNFNFTKIKDEDSILIRLAEFSNNHIDMLMMVVFEFVLLLKKDTQVIEMSSGWASLDLHLLREAKTHLLTLNGGTPQRRTTINREDVKTRRKGWRSMVKSLSSPIESRLKVEIKPLSKLATDIKEKLEFMPKKIVLPKNNINFYLAYRDYLGRSLSDSIKQRREIDLQNDLISRFFTKSIDCPDIQMPLINFWNLQIIPKMGKLKNEPILMNEYFKQTINNMYLMICTEDFKFHHMDPTLIVLHDGILLQRRSQLLKAYLENILIELRLINKTKSKKATDLDIKKNVAYQPFDIQELFEDDNDSRQILAQLQQLKHVTQDQRGSQKRR